jgi:4-hydroxyphenylpyruvate dioxygenase
VGTARSGLNSIVLNPAGSPVLLPLNEPTHNTPVRSQIASFLDNNGGYSGIQHVALRCDDCVETVLEMKKRGVEFVDEPGEEYYDSVFESPNAANFTEREKAGIKRAGLLVDFETTPASTSVRTLLQTFTKPLNPDRPGLFFEFIQRKGCEEADDIGCGGFGTGNFKRLFEAVEAMEMGRDKSN